MSKIVAADIVAMGAGASAQQIIPLLADPTTGGGVAAPVGSIGLLNSGSAGSFYVKQGAANTAWALVAVNGSIAGLVASTTFAETGVISPTAITGSNNNYAPTGFATCSHIRQALSAAATLTGLAGGVSGQKITIINIATTQADTLTFTHNDASSLAGNRFLLPNGLSWILPINGAATFGYDGTDLAWRLEAVVTNQFPSGNVNSPGLIIGSDVTAGIFFDGTNPNLCQGGQSAMTWAAGTTVATGTLTVTSGTTLDGLFETSGVISPPAFTGVAVNNYAPTNLLSSAIVRQDCTSPTVVSGLLAGGNGQNIWFFNIDTTPANTITLLHQSVLSSPANQFLLSSANNLVIPINGGVLLTYDVTSAAWRVTGKNF